MTHVISEHRLVGFGQDAVGIPYANLPDLVVELSGQSAERMAREMLNHESMTIPPGFPHLENLLSEPVRGALALFPIAFAHHYFYAIQCLELELSQQKELYQGCETAISKLISVNDVLALLRVCREVFRLVARAMPDTEDSSQSTHRRGKIHFGFSNEAVRFSYQAALGASEGDRLEKSVIASPVVAGLNIAAEHVGASKIALCIEGNCRFRWC